MKKYVVELARGERRDLQELVKKGKAAAYRIKHANILLKADQAKGGPTWTDEQIVEAFGCHVTTVANVRKRFVEEGFEAAVGRRQEGVGRPKKLDGDVEAQMTVIACSDPPEGHQRWTVRLIANRLVELQLVDKCSHVTVHRAMKKTS
jgi:transposase